MFLMNTLCRTVVNVYAKCGFEAYSKFTVMPVGEFRKEFLSTHIGLDFLLLKEKTVYGSLIHIWYFLAHDSCVIHVYALASLCDTVGNVMTQISRSDSKLSKEIN